MRVREALGPLSERPFRYQFLATTTSVIGDSLVPVALTFAVLDLTASATDLGAVLAVRTLVMVGFFLVGGVWADRVPRQRLMMISDIGRAATQATLGVLLITRHAELWHFFALEAMNGAATAFFQPAQVGLTPKTVSPQRLKHANALLSLTYSTAGIVGPALAGVIVSTLGPGWALTVDGATFLTSAFFLLRIQLPNTLGTVEKRPFLGDLSEGWNEVRSRSWVWISILNFMIFQLLALPAFFVLGPFIAKRSLGGAAAWAMILTASGLGSLIGDFLAMHVEPSRPLRAAFLSGLLTVPSLLLLASKAPLWAISVSAIPWGIALSFSGVLWFTTLQEHIPDAALSRVSSYDWVGSTALRPLGFAAAGPLAAIMGLEETLLGAAIIVGLTQIAIILVPSISNLPRVASDSSPPIP